MEQEITPLEYAKLLLVIATVGLQGNCRRMERELAEVKGVLATSSLQDAITKEKNLLSNIADFLDCTYDQWGRLVPKK